MTNAEILERAVTDICNDARLSSKGKHGDYYRCIIAQAIADAVAELRAENEQLKAERDNWRVAYRQSIGRPE